MGIIRENIDFQRGIEPKQAMGLGLMAKWMSIEKDDLLRIKRTFSTDAENHLDDKARYHTFREGDFLDVNIGPNKYSDGCIGFSAYIEDERIRSSDDFFMWGTPLEFDQRLEILTGLRESLDFERGLDPKKSMKIGQTQLIPKDIDWDCDPLDNEFYEFISVAEFIPNWKGFPILVVRVKDKKTMETGYYAFSNTGIGRTGFTVYGPQRALKNIKANLRYNASWKLESVNFERGLDPKKAMKIGKNFLPYKKGDKVKVYCPWEKRVVEVRVNEDEDLDSDGNPRIKKMISTTKPAWPVRRIWVRYNGEVRTANLAIDPEFPEMDRWVLHQ